MFTLTFKASCLCIFVAVSSTQIIAQETTVFDINGSDQNRFVAVKARAAETLERRCRIGYAQPESILSPLAGVMEIHIGNDDTVTDGQLLASFDTTQLDRQRERMVARSELLRLQADQKHEMRKLQDLLEASSLERLGRELDESESALARLVEMAATGRVSEAEQNASERHVETLRQARDDAAVQFDITRITDELRNADLVYEVFSLGLDLDALDEKIALTSLTAPHDGLVISIQDTLAANGRGLVREGADLFQIANPMALNATHKVTEEDMLSMRNAKVFITSQGGQNPTVEARIANITALGAELFSTDDYEFELRFSPEFVGQWDIDSGATCLFEVALPNSSGAAIPIDAILFENGRSYVEMALPSGEVVRQPVSLGTQVEGLVNVHEGIEVGDIVLR